MAVIAQVNDATGFVDTGLSAGVTYTYQISVQSYIGTSGASNTSTVTTPIGIADLPQNGLTMWLRSTSGTEGSGPLSVWVDQSGSGNNALQTTSAQQPQVVDGQANGLPVIRFNGSNTLTLPQNMLQAAQSGQSPRHREGKRGSKQFRDALEFRIGIRIHVCVGQSLGRFRDLGYE